MVVTLPFWQFVKVDDYERIGTREKRMQTGRYFDKMAEGLGEWKMVV